MNMHKLRLLVLILGLAFVLGPLSFAYAQQEGNGSASADASVDVKLSPEVTEPGISPAELEVRLVPLTKAELKQLAEEWGKIVKSKTEEVMELSLIHI